MHTSILCLHLDASAPGLKALTSMLDLFTTTTSDVILSDPASDDVMTENNFKTDHVISTAKPLNISSIVLGMLLFIAIIIIIILIIRLCRMHNELRASERQNSKPLTPAARATVEATRQLMTPVDQNGSASKVTPSTKNGDRPDVRYKNVAQRETVSNGRVHDDVYIDVHRQM